MTPPAQSPEFSDAPDGHPRLQKVLARAGVASRRHAEVLMGAGRVRVNGQVARAVGLRVNPQADVIEVDGRRVGLTAEAVYMALHKPRGFLTTAHDPQGRSTVMDLLPDVPGLVPVGRLDAETEGLILLTTDGEWAQRVAHPRFAASKEYLATVRGLVTADTLVRLRQPLDIGHDEVTSGAAVDLISGQPGTSIVRLVLHEGRNRQVRRMFLAVGYEVLRLVRVRIGRVTLGPLAAGRWRELQQSEIDWVFPPVRPARTTRVAAPPLSAWAERPSRGTPPEKVARSARAAPPAKAARLAGAAQPAMGTPPVRTARPARNGGAVPRDRAARPVRAR